MEAVVSLPADGGLTAACDALGVARIGLERGDLRHPQLKADKIRERTEIDLLARRTTWRGICLRLAQ